jgi:hypothetical protein
MVAVAKGRSYSHHGWTFQNGRENKRTKTYCGFTSPEGQRVVITNLSAFCQASGLNVVCMYILVSGKGKRHKGWTWRENDD